MCVRRGAVAAVIGAAAGYILSGVLLSVWIDPSNPPPYLQPDDVEWVGAWWLGFVITGTLGVGCGLDQCLALLSISVWAVRCGFLRCLADISFLGAGAITVFVGVFGMAYPAVLPNTEHVRAALENSGEVTNVPLGRGNHRRFSAGLCAVLHNPTAIFNTLASSFEGVVRLTRAQQATVVPLRLLGRLFCTWDGLVVTRAVPARRQ